MLSENREKFHKLSIKVGMIFGKIPLSPNQWTLLSLLPAIASAWFLANSDYWIAAAFFGIAAFIDFIDGSVARVSGRVTKFGGYLDTIVDRYVEFFIVFALLFVSVPGVIVPIQFWVIIYLFGSMMTTYVKAAAKEKEIVREGQELRGGILERAERMIILFAAIVLAPFNAAVLSSAIVLLAVLSNYTALERILKTRNLARKFSHAKLRPF